MLGPLSEAGLDLTTSNSRLKSGSPREGQERFNWRWLNLSLLQKCERRERGEREDVELYGKRERGEMSERDTERKSPENTK
jgi:hypothetical protein